MVIKDDIVNFFVSVGVRNYLRLKLSPDPKRKTNEFLVDPSSKSVTVNKRLVTSTELFAQLFQAKTASIDAKYDGGFSDVGVPLEKITEADLVIEMAAITFLTEVPSGGEKQKTVKLDSCNGVVGGTKSLSLVPRVGAKQKVKLTTCVVIVDDEVVADATQLVRFLMSRRDISMTPYLDGSNLVKVELETDG